MRKPFMMNNRFYDWRMRNLMGTQELVDVTKFLEAWKPVMLSDFEMKLPSLKVHTVVSVRLALKRYQIRFVP